MVDLGALRGEIIIENGSAIAAFNETRQQSQSTAQAMETDWKKVGENLSNVGSSMTKWLTVPIATVATACVKLASDMVETTSKIDQVFKENAGAVNEWASTSIESMGLARQTALDAAATFGDMGNGMGIAADQSVEMSTSLVQLAADMASFKNISVERALVALQGVYTGETEALKSLGVVMTEANLQQFAMNQGITESISEMSQAEKVALRYQFVLSATSDAQGDFARTGGSVANQARMVQENLKELGTQFGEILYPMVNKALSGINNFLKSLQQLNPEQRQTVVTIALVVAAIGPLLTIAGKAVTGIASLKTAFATLNVTLTSATGVIGLVVAAVSLLVGAIASLHAKQQAYVEQGRETVNAYLDEQRAKFLASGEAAQASAEQAQSLTEKLKEMAEVDPDIDIETNADAVTPEVEGLASSLGGLLLATDDLAGAVEEACGAWDDYIAALVEVKRAATAEHILYLTEQYNAGVISLEEYTRYTNESIAAYYSQAEAITGASGAFDELIGSIETGGEIGTESLENFAAAVGMVTEAAGNISDTIDSAAEGMSRLAQAASDGTISQGGYNVVAQQTANLMKGEMTSAVEKIFTAYGNYNTAVENAYAAEQLEIQAAQELVTATGTKIEAIDLFATHLLNGRTSVEAMQAVEEIYGTETAAALKQSFQEKGSSASTYYSDSIVMAGEWKGQMTALEEALATESGTIAENRKEAITAAETALATELSEITSGWTEEQVQQFAALCEEAGLTLDEGTLGWLGSINAFITNATTTMGEGGGEAVEALLQELAAIDPALAEIVGQMATQGNAMGNSLSSGVASGIRAGIEAIKAAAQAAAGAAKGAIAAVMEIKSPSRVMQREVGVPMAEGVAVGFEKGMQQSLKRMQQSMSGIVAGSSAGAEVALAKNTNYSTVNRTANIVQNNTFTSRELTPYEQQLQIKRLNRDLARGLA